MNQSLSIFWFLQFNFLSLCSLVYSYKYYLFRFLITHTPTANDLQDSAPQFWPKSCQLINELINLVQGPLIYLMKKLNSRKSLEPNKRNFLTSSWIDSYRKSIQETVQAPQHSITMAKKINIILMTLKFLIQVIKDIFQRNKARHGGRSIMELKHQKLTNRVIKSKQAFIWLNSFLNGVVEFPHNRGKVEAACRVFIKRKFVKIRGRWIISHNFNN